MLGLNYKGFKGFLHLVIKVVRHFYSMKGQSILEDIH